MPSYLLFKARMLGAYVKPNGLLCFPSITARFQWCAIARANGFEVRWLIRINHDRHIYITHPRRRYCDCRF